MKAYIIDRDLIGLFSLQYRIRRFEVFDDIMVCDDLDRARNFILRQSEATIGTYLFMIHMNAESVPELRLLDQLRNEGMAHLKMYIVSEHCGTILDGAVEGYPLIMGILGRPIGKKTLQDLIPIGTGGGHPI